MVWMESVKEIHASKQPKELGGATTWWRNGANAGSTGRSRTYKSGEVQLETTTCGCSVEFLDKNTTLFYNLQSIHSYFVVKPNPCTIVASTDDGTLFNWGQSNTCKASRTIKPSGKLDKFLQLVQSTTRKFLSCAMVSGKAVSFLALRKSRYDNARHDARPDGSDAKYLHLETTKSSNCMQEDDMSGNCVRPVHLDKFNVFKSGKSSGGKLVTALHSRMYTCFNDLGNVLGKDSNALHLVKSNVSRLGGNVDIVVNTLLPLVVGQPRMRVTRCWRLDRLGSDCKL